MRPTQTLLTIISALVGSTLSMASHAEQVIVKFKADSELSQQALVQKQAQTSQKINLREQAQMLGVARAQALTKSTGLSIQAASHVADNIQAMDAQNISAQDLARRLSMLPQVQYAVVSQRKRVAAVPNDARFGGQWWLQNAQPSAINTTAAWDITTGSNLIVAVLDTGVRLDHEDLQGKLVPGYDFVSDPATANDGDGRDNDPNDPGDWIDSTDTAQAAFRSCPIENSSWHGTRVSGIIGASTNNTIGVSGVSWGARILPIRALGKCGGTDADILAGMRWAAGLNVPGIPNNPNPAKIINMSLGSSNACTAPYRDLIAELKAMGVMVVASAGNEAGKAVGEPANCPGAVGVAGLRHIGTKVGFSSLGPEVAISAPGGNCGTGSECQFPINTTTNAGTKGPTTSAYTDGFNPNVGTSFSAPIVAGVAALMWTIDPNQSVDTVVSRMRNSAKAFPTSTDPNIPACVAPNASSQGECNCNTAVCGAGMLNAQAAVSSSVPVPNPPVNQPPPNPPPATTPPSSGGGGGALAPWWSLLGLAGIGLMGWLRHRRRQ